jgi:hypothetical protein
MAKVSASKLEELEIQYENSTKLYHQYGEEARGTAEGSAARHGYEVIKKRWILDGQSLSAARQSQHRKMRSTKRLAFYGKTS